MSRETEGEGFVVLVELNDVRSSTGGIRPNQLTDLTTQRDAGCISGGTRARKITSTTSLSRRAAGGENDIQL